MKLPHAFSTPHAVITMNTAIVLGLLAVSGVAEAQRRSVAVTSSLAQQTTQQPTVEARTTVLPVVAIQHLADEPTILIVASPEASGGQPSPESSLCQPGDLQVWDPAARIYRLCNQRAESNQQPVTTSCGSNSLQYFDVTERVWRPCPAQPTARGVGAGARCAGGSLQYFDESEQIYRPCPGTPFGVTTVAREPLADRCRPGDSQYFDTREQIFRPCPVSANHPRPTPVITPVSRSRGRPGRGDCPAGMLQYYDRTLRLFRPCPEPVNNNTNSAPVERNQ